MFDSPEQTSQAAPAAPAPRPEKEHVAVVASSSEPFASPQEYREIRREVSGYQLAAMAVTVELLENPRRARYHYHCRLKTTGPSPARYWLHELPAGDLEIGDLRAWDGRGTLQTRMVRKNGSPCIQVRLRAAVPEGGTCEFGYGYEAVIRSVVVVGWRSRTVSYADWQIFNLPCEDLRVTVLLPPRCVRVGSVPAPPEDDEHSVTYRMRDVRPLEALSYMVAYRRAQLGLPFYRWVASAIGSGLIGALIALAVEGW